MPTTVSRAWLATSFFNRAFSRLEFFEPFGLVGLHPAVLGKPAMRRRLTDLQVPAHLIEFLAGHPRSLLPSASLWMS